MSHLIARLLLSMLVFPLGGLIYTIAVVTAFESLGWRSDTEAWIFAGAVTWVFVAAYWWLLWRKSVQWTAQRIGVTVGAACVATITGTLIGAACDRIDHGFGGFAGTTAIILLWLVSTCFIWREDRGERAARLTASGRDSVVCPTCGYNLTGLKEPRCPECGSQFTLDQLLASQPNRATAELVE